MWQLPVQVINSFILFDLVRWLTIKIFFSHFHRYWVRGLEFIQDKYNMGSGDELPHQILSYDLLFSPFYHFPSTDPLSHTTLMWPSVQLMWPSQPSLTIPYTHRTISLALCCRFGIWPMDHTVLLPIFSSFSVTQCALLWANWSQAITLCGQGFTTCFAAHKPCAHFCLSFVFKTLVSTPNRRKFFPQNSDLVRSAWLFCLTPLHTFALLCTSNSPHTLVPSQTFAFHCLTLPAIMLGDRPVEIRTSFTFSLYEHLFTFIYFLLYPTIDSALAPYYLDYSFIMVSSSYSKLRCMLIICSFFWIHN